MTYGLGCRVGRPKPLLHCTVPVLLSLWHSHGVTCATVIYEWFLYVVLSYNVLMSEMLFIFHFLCTYFNAMVKCFSLVKCYTSNVLLLLTEVPLSFKMYLRELFISSGDSIPGPQGPPGPPGVSGECEPSVQRPSLLVHILQWALFPQRPYWCQHGHLVNKVHRFLKID